MNIVKTWLNRRFCYDYDVIKFKRKLTIESKILPLLYTRLSIEDVNLSFSCLLLDLNHSYFCLSLDLNHSSFCLSWDVN